MAFLFVVFRFFLNNTHRLMSHMTMTENNLTNLGLNSGQLVCLVPGWVIWPMVSFYFRCHTVFQWFMWWWRRVTCTRISKYWWHVYRRMYRRCQNLFYYTNDGWIMNWSDVCRIIWNGLIQVDAVFTNVNWVRIFQSQFRIDLVWFQFTEFLRPIFSFSKYFCTQRFWTFVCL